MVLYVYKIYINLKSRLESLYYPHIRFKLKKRSLYSPFNSLTTDLNKVKAVCTLYSPFNSLTSDLNKAKAVSTVPSYTNIRFK